MLRKKTCCPQFKKLNDLHPSKENLAFFESRTNNLDDILSSLQRITPMQISIGENIRNIFRSTHWTDFAFIISETLKKRSVKIVLPILTGAGTYAFSKIIEKKSTNQTNPISLNPNDLITRLKESPEQIIENFQEIFHRLIAIIQSAPENYLDGFYELAKHSTMFRIASFIGIMVLTQYVAWIADYKSRIYKEKTNANSFEMMKDFKLTKIITHLGVIYDEVFSHEIKTLGNKKDVVKFNKEVERITGMPANEFLILLRTQTDNYFDVGIHGERQKLILDTIKLIKPIIDIYKEKNDSTDLRCNFEKIPPGEIASIVMCLHSLVLSREPQAVQTYETGLDLKLLEDWYKEFLNDKDHLTAAAKEFPVLKECRDISESLLSRFLRKFFVFPANPTVTDRLTKRKISIMAGRIIKEMADKYTNKKYDTPYINAQHILLADDRQDSVLIQYYTEHRQKHIQRLLRILSRKEMFLDKYEKTTIEFGDIEEVIANIDDEKYIAKLRRNENRTEIFLDSYYRERNKEPVILKRFHEPMYRKIHDTIFGIPKKKYCTPKEREIIKRFFKERDHEKSLFENLKKLKSQEFGIKMKLLFAEFTNDSDYINKIKKEDQLLTNKRRDIFKDLKITIELEKKALEDWLMIKEAYGKKILLDLEKQRSLLAKKIFSKDIDTLKKHIFSEFEKAYKIALNIKIALDPEFVTGDRALSQKNKKRAINKNDHGTLDFEQTLLTEHYEIRKEYGVDIMPIKQIEQIVTETRSEMRLLERFLELKNLDSIIKQNQGNKGIVNNNIEFSHISISEDKEMRAVQIAYHLNDKELKTRVKQFLLDLDHFITNCLDNEKIGPIYKNRLKIKLYIRYRKIRKSIYNFIESEGKNRTRIQTARLFHSLNKVHIQTWVEMFEKLGKYKPKESMDLPDGVQIHSS